MRKGATFLIFLPVNAPRFRRKREDDGTVLFVGGIMSVTDHQDVNAGQPIAERRGVRAGDTAC
jgi:hypothetical protein